MQIPDEIRKSVVYVAYLTKEGIKRLVGTAFFINMFSECKTKAFVYLVTAHHNIAKVIDSQDAADENIYIRINKRNGGYDFLPLPINAFVPHEERTDVTILKGGPDIEIYDYMTIPTNLFLDDSIIQEKSIGIGDEVFMIGLFINHYGKKRNEPIARFGNISAMPNEPIQTAKFGDLDAYLVELRSIGGLSGSPVFLHLSLTRGNSNTVQFQTGPKIYLLGILHGHWDLKNATQDIILEDFSDKVDKEKINTGIGIVVPATKILENLNQFPFG